MSNWTDEELDLMTRKYIDRRTPKEEKERVVSDDVLLNELRIKVEKQ
jgi:hypothetical protein